MATVYILYSLSIDRYYIGSCQDLEIRLQEHRNNFYRTGFTHRADDWELFFSISLIEYPIARKIEKHIKNMKSRKYIENLKAYPKIIENS